MRTYEEFKNVVIEVAEDMGLVAVPNMVEKEDRTYEGIQIFEEDSKVGVCLDVATRYEIDSDASKNEIREYIEYAVNSCAVLQNCGIDMATLGDYANVRDKLYVTLLSMNTPDEYLAGVPHRDYEDLHMIYRIKLGENGDDGCYSSVVTNSILKMWNVSEEQLHADALINSQKINPIRIDSLGHVMSQFGVCIGDNPLEGIDPDGPNVVSDHVRLSGAACFFYDGVMQKIAEKIGSFWMLPSSTEEVLVIPECMGEASSLNAMVKEINSNEVETDLQLQDHAYHYDVETGKFEAVHC